jgi:hypothetical protein
LAYRADGDARGQQLLSCSLLDVYSKRVDNWMADELREVPDALEREVGRSAQ